jgi:hypothetical protein
MTLKEIEEKLRRRGVRDVKFCFSPDVKEAGYNKVYRDVTRFLQAYLEGKFRVVKKFGL